MPKFGYKLMTEEHGPKVLVENAIRAEKAGFISSPFRTISTPGSSHRAMRPLLGASWAPSPMLRIALASRPALPVPVDTNSFA